MKICSAPVSYQTHVRPVQVRDMIRLCRDLQDAFYRLTGESTPDTFLRPSGEPDWLSIAMRWPRQPEVKAFLEGALHNHFVCANWKTFDELKNDQFCSRESLLQSRSPVLGGADFGWLRRYIHSVVVWEVQEFTDRPPTLQLAMRAVWPMIAQALQRELDQVEQLHADPWVEVRRSGKK